MADFYKADAEKPHWSVGMGLKLAMNENFILSADYGLALNDQDGKMVYTLPELPV